MDYSPSNNRYESMLYRPCGISGLKLPALSLGMWHNFGDIDSFDTGRKIIHAAFDAGITHFDLANNYGTPYGSAEDNMGRIIKKDLHAYRDELIISSKAGYDMWPGPYGIGSSRKYLIASCNQSLKRLGVEYVDIFYSHCYNAETPIEETMMALDQIVRQGKALYAGISNYGPDEAQKAFDILRDLGTPCLIHQPRYSMFERTPEHGLFNTLEANGVGAIVYSPLAQGLLTDKYLKEIPENSRVAKDNPFLTKDHLTPEILVKISQLNTLAGQRNQSLAQMAIAWILRDERVSSVLIGASSIKQLQNNLGALKNIHFSQSEYEQIEQILAS
ncbi:MAG TPA: L-glyceraldehyde 3-phosphate reductase [Bacteroidales bacterium]|nr:L-glyceraldehyde 3-phosphate reductase [Bacteroidales bacterium]